MSTAVYAVLHLSNALSCLVNQAECLIDFWERTTFLIAMGKRCVSLPN
jgi:hypothetical protein